MSDTPETDIARLELTTCFDPLNRACEIIESLERRLRAAEAENAALLREIGTLRLKEMAHTYANAPQKKMPEPENHSEPTGSAGSPP